MVYANTARPDRDEGRVGRDRIQFIKESLVEDKFNVLVMHHHLIPVPDTLLELAIVEDACDVLKLLSKISPSRLEWSSTPALVLET